MEEASGLLKYILDARILKTLMELEIGELDIPKKPTKRKELIENLRFWVWCVGESDREYLNHLVARYEEIVETVIERRKRHILRIHQLRVAWAQRILHELQLEFEVYHEYWEDITSRFDNKREQLNRSATDAIKKACGTRQFTRLFLRVLKQWKTKRDREIHAMAEQEARVIREATTRYLANRRDPLLVAHQMLTRPRNYEDIAWLGKDVDKIDIMSLEGKSLEETCFLP